MEFLSKNDWMRNATSYCDDVWNVIIKNIAILFSFFYVIIYKEDDVVLLFTKLLNIIKKSISILKNQLT